MTTESSASDSSACGNLDAYSYRRSLSLASKLKLKKLTPAKPEHTVNLPVHNSSPSEYFTSNSHSDGGKSFNKRKRAAKNVSDTSNTKRFDSQRNDGPPLVTSAKRTRPRRNKCQNTQATKRTAKRNACQKRVESEVSLTTEIDASSSDRLQPSCPAVQSCSETCSFAPEPSNDDNTSSSSDVEWEDVEGSNLS